MRSVADMNSTTTGKDTKSSQESVVVFKPNDQLSPFELNIRRRLAGLFFIDIHRLRYQYTLNSFEKTEPGYTQSMINAYHLAFATKLNRQITPEFILAVHQKIMAHNSDVRPGRCSDAGIFFTIARYRKITKEHITGVQPFNITEDGFWEFVQIFMLNKKLPHHTVVFKPREPNPQAFTYSLFIRYDDAHQRKLLLGQINVKANSCAILPLSAEELKKFVNHLLQNNDYLMEINCRSPNQLSKLGYQGTVEDLVTDEMKEICARYNTDILKAQTQEEQLRIILLFTIHMDREHFL